MTVCALLYASPCPSNSLPQRTNVFIGTSFVIAVFSSLRRLRRGLRLGLRELVGQPAQRRLAMLPADACDGIGVAGLVRREDRRVLFLRLAQVDAHARGQARITF